MLKIRDGIDLKELEKFGFELTYLDLFYNYIKYIDEDIDDRQVLLRVFSDTREIIVEAQNIEIFAFGNLTTLFDLIQANMVEKVSDE